MGKPETERDTEAGTTAAAEVLAGVSPEEAPADASKAQQAYHYIRQRIFDRTFAPGHRIIMGPIAEELGVSVVPVREAIRRLEAEGVVTYERNVGARVAMLDSAGYLEVMDTVAILEGAATAQSAPYLTAADLSKARELNEKLEGTVSDRDGFEPAVFTELNQKFHRTLFGKCPNRRLIELVYEQWQRLNYLRESTFAFVPERALESVEEHRQLVSLIEAGADLEWIETFARRHRERTAVTFRDRAKNHRPRGDPY